MRHRGLGDWDDVLAELATSLRTLDPCGFVTLDPPEPAGAEPTPRDGLLARFRRRHDPRSKPLVQLTRDDGLEAECSGPVDGRARGADFPWTAEQQRLLRELGWQEPDGVDDWHMYRWRRPSGPGPATPDPGVGEQAARDGARLAVATLRDVYGLASPQGLTFVVDSFL